MGKSLLGISFVLAAVLGATLFAAGCSHPDSIVGTWSGTWTNPRLPGASYKITSMYNADGTGTCLMDYPYGQIGGGITYDLNGDNTLTQTATSMQQNGKNVLLDPNKKLPSEVYQFKIDGDTLTMETKTTGARIVMTRSK